MPGLIKTITALSAGMVCVCSISLKAQTVEPGESGQIGPIPDFQDQVIGASIESIRGTPGEILLGGLYIFGGGMPPPAFEYYSDVIHGPQNPVLAATESATFNNVFAQPPKSDRRQNASSTGDFVAFSFASDGSMAGKMNVGLIGLDETGTVQSSVTIADVETIQVMDSALSATDIVVDEMGRGTLVFVESALGTSTVRGQRFDLNTGVPIETAFEISPGLVADPSAALRDLKGTEVVVAMTDFASNEVVGRVIDFGGGSPAVMAQFPISSTPAALINNNPSIDADLANGTFIVAWEHLTGAMGNPVDVRARRFDSNGDPVGDDFLVNSTTDNAQGQTDVAVGPNGEAVIVWAGDTEGFDLDVFFQVYDSDGNPIGGEIRVNEFRDDFQDRPVVRFLPEPDAQGNSQFVVTWRDVGSADGTGSRGTGISYRCFSIVSNINPDSFFDHGFELGDS